jgi:hypothetical protein
MKPSERASANTCAEVKKMQRAAGSSLFGCRLMPGSAHKYLRGRAKRCSGGQQLACRLVPASEHKYLRGEQERGNEFFIKLAFAY